MLAKRCALDGQPEPPTARDQTRKSARRLLRPRSLQIHVLEFLTSDELAWAMRVLLDDPRVEDCLAEPEELRLRFRAPGDRAPALLERIYAHGGLSWVSRHTLRAPQGGDKKA